MTVADGRDTVAVFAAIKAVCRTSAERDIVMPVAEELARYADAGLEVDDTGANEHRADIVVMNATGARASARRLLDAGTAVVVVPPPSHGTTPITRVGIGYDGGKPADSALDTARALVRARPGQITDVELAHVDHSLSAVAEAQDEVVSSRRAAVIEWWLEHLGSDIPAHVRVRRPVGDPATELAQLSDQLDLLVIGTRGRAPLRRALTGSVSATLMEMTRCPLLIVPPDWRPDPPPCLRGPGGTLRRSPRSWCEGLDAVGLRG